MAVSATQATLLLKTYQDSLLQSRSAVLETRYSDIFAQITSRSNLGVNKLTIPVVINQFQELRVYLISLGYTVSLPQTDPASNGTLTTTVTWPTASPNAITAITPTQIIALVGSAVTQSLTPIGGVAPYSFTVTGTLPNGLIFGANAGVDVLAITGIPTVNAVTALSITATDSQGISFTTTLGVSVGNAALSNMYVLPTASPTVLGGVRVDNSSIVINNGIITAPYNYTYTLPTASTTTLGGVKVDGATVTINNGIITAPYTYTLPTASTTTLGGVKVDGFTIGINNGVIALQPSTFLTQQIRNSAIAIAAAMA
jgi:hypothetical protein